MLLARDPLRGDLLSDLDSIHNFYEGLVFEEINHRLRGQEADTIADIACVALNHLPTRYIRHDVDMMFYLSPDEKQEMNRKVAEAVTHAIEFVESRQRD